MMKKEFKYIIKYLRENIILTLIFCYFIISVILNSLNIIDITIPCLWTSIFGYECPGCGFTTACQKVIHLDFIGAFESNKLFFIIAPALAYYIIVDYLKFREKQTK